MKKENFEDPDADRLVLGTSRKASLSIREGKRASIPAAIVLLSDDEDVTRSAGPFMHPNLERGTRAVPSLHPNLEMGTRDDPIIID